MDGVFSSSGSQGARLKDHCCLDHWVSDAENMALICCVFFNVVSKFSLRTFRPNSGVADGVQVEGNSSEGEV